MEEDLSYYERVTKPQRKQRAQQAAAARYEDCDTSSLTVRGLLPDTAPRLVLLAKQMGYQGRETFVRDVLEKVSLLTPEQVKAFFELPMFL